ncbi:hypothetical protein [Octadecabacter sp. R77987]|uniref:hypothetical protein n=1 Tax=Octadecabacter sp. R77987 TaxID=3093874 RepID=UPI00366F523B
MTASQANALSEERAFQLFDVVELGLKCDATSGYLRATLANERLRIREIYSVAGLELGSAMYGGTLSGANGNYGRQCLTRFVFPTMPDIEWADVTFNVGYTLGASRACLAEVYRYELESALGISLFAVVEPNEERDHRRRVQQYSIAKFEELNCRGLQLPD